MIIALVGMAGSGKSEATQYFKELKLPTFRFGDITDEELAKKNLPVTPANEKRIREQLRKQHGMDIYGKRAQPKIDKLLELSDIVIVDGLYSWEEYTRLKKAYGSDLVILAIVASPKTRHSRLANRPVRPLTAQEARLRDYAEIETLHKAGPIAMADHVIVNEGTKQELETALDRFFRTVKR